MLKDKGLLVLFTTISMAFGFALVINGNDYWWLFWFSMLFFYGHLVNKLLEEERRDTWFDNFIDDGYTDNIPSPPTDKDYYCKECGYKVCVCKPVVN